MSDDSDGCGGDGTTVTAGVASYGVGEGGMGGRSFLREEGGPVGGGFFRGRGGGELIDWGKNFLSPGHKFLVRKSQREGGVVASL